MKDLVNAWARRLPTWIIYVLGAGYAGWLFWLGATGGLGAEPIRELERELGGQALMLLIGGLSITPLRRYLGLNLIRFRRAIGLLTFYYVALHLLVWLVLDVQAVSQIWADILKRPFVTIGMSAFALMVPLALTSNNWSVRRLGPKWRSLHKLVYPAAILGGTHYVILVKGFPLEPLIYLAVIGALLLCRWKRPPQFRLRTS